MKPPRFRRPALALVAAATPALLSIGCARCASSGWAQTAPSVPQTTSESTVNLTTIGDHVRTRDEVRR